MPRVPIRGDDWWEDENQFMGFGSAHTMNDDKPRAGDPKMGPIGFVHFPDQDVPKRKKRRVSPAKSNRRR